MQLFKKWFFLMLISASFSVFAADKFQEGKEYQRAPRDIAQNEMVQDLVKEANGKVQVIEFFSYACHWCYSLEPHLQKWQINAPKYVSFQRYPVEFQPNWAALSKAYYTHINLKAFDKIHPALFEAVQTEKLTNTSTDSLRQFFVSRGINGDDFTKAFDSFDVAHQQKRANALSRAFKITAIPAIIVQGPKGIFITSVRMAGGEEDLVKVLDYLVKMQSEGLKKSQGK